MPEVAPVTSAMPGAVALELLAALIARRFE
jgi:hypothetical protein